MPPKKQSFEDSFQKLEVLVKKLEEGKLSLEESMKSFEEGMQLSKHCEGLLQEATGKVEKLMTDAQGARIRIPFEEEKN